MPQIYKKAENEDEAKRRAARFLECDPFPKIPCALLSSAEISDYARVTAMLFPFWEDSLKSASYEAHLGGRFIIWHSNGRREDRMVKRGDKCILPANSICYVQVEPIIRLPNYLAIRFNLRITHVHRGLLLGTGPLVDPGFQGQLLIPLHNLTASDYELNTNDALIWIEFTKTTYGIEALHEEMSSTREFRPFPEKGKHLTPDTYLYKANGGNPIQNSIPNAVRASEEKANQAAQSASEAQTSAGEAKAEVERVRNWLLGGSAAAALILAIALFALFYDVFGLVQNASSSLNTTVDSLTELHSEIHILRTRIDTQRNEQSELAASVHAVSVKLMNIEPTPIEGESPLVVSLEEVRRDLLALQNRLEKLETVGEPIPHDSE